MLLLIDGTRSSLPWLIGRERANEEVIKRCALFSLIEGVRSPDVLLDGGGVDERLVTLSEFMLLDVDDAVIKVGG